MINCCRPPTKESDLTQLDVAVLWEVISYCLRIGNLSFWGSGRPRGRGRPFQKVGGFAPHFLEWYPGRPGPPRPPKLTRAPCEFQNLSLSPGAGRAGNRRFVGSKRPPPIAKPTGNDGGRSPPPFLRVFPRLCAVFDPEKSTISGPSLKNKT